MRYSMWGQLLLCVGIWMLMPLNFIDGAEENKEKELTFSFQVKKLLAIQPFNNNRDFPELYCVEESAESAKNYYVVIIDAENGRETWNIKDDPIILLITIFPNKPPEIRVDYGFLSNREPERKLVPAEEVISANNGWQGLLRQILRDLKKLIKPKPSPFPIFTPQILMNTQGVE